jgi:hypothetical protein
MDRRMSKENDFKPKQNIRTICSYGNLDNIVYFCFFFGTSLAFFQILQVLAYLPILNQKIKLFFQIHGSALCVNAQGLYANAQALCANAQWLKVASADPVR